MNPGVPPVTPLTLSSPTKATLFRIILWRCSARFEHKIARSKPHASAVGMRQRRIRARPSVSSLDGGRALPSGGRAGGSNPRGAWRECRHQAGIGGGIRRFDREHQAVELASRCAPSERPHGSEADIELIDGLHQRDAARAIRLVNSPSCTAAAGCRLSCSDSRRAKLQRGQTGKSARRLAAVARLPCSSRRSVNTSRHEPELSAESRARPKRPIEIKACGGGKKRGRAPEE
jgi:hypothetical protein